MHAFFLIPVLLIGLSIIPAFFIGKKLGGNLGGFLAGMIVAINYSLLSRTPAGFSDTDPANIIFPLFIMWFFLEAFYSDNWKKTGVYSVLGGITFYLFTQMWRPYHIFDFILGAVVIFAFIIAVNEIYTTKKLDIKALFDRLKSPLGKSGLFLIFGLGGIILGSSLNAIVNLYTQIIGFVQMKMHK